jgi:hypothetical protein
MARRERLPRDGATVQEYRFDRIVGFDVLERIGAEQSKVCFLPGLDRPDLLVEPHDARVVAALTAAAHARKLPVFIHALRATLRF